MLIHLAPSPHGLLGRPDTKINSLQQYGVNGEGRYKLLTGEVDRRMITCWEGEVCLLSCLAKMASARAR